MSKLKSIAWAICLLLMLTLAPALGADEGQEREEVFSGWLDAEDEFEVGDTDFSIMYANADLFCEFEGKTLTIPEGECRKEQPFEICFLETRKMKDGEEVPDDIHDKDTDTQVKLEVFAYSADLSVLRVFEKTSILPGEYITVKVYINNSGMIKATGISYEEELPNSVAAYQKSCSVKDNTITWKGELFSDRFYTCEYVLHGLESDEFESKAEAVYWNGYEEKKAVHEKDIEVREEALMATFELADSRIGLGEQTGCVINLTNTYEEEIDVKKVSLVVPVGVNLISSDGFSLGLSWSGKLAPEGSKVLEAGLQGIATGEHKLRLMGDYTVSGLRANLSLSEELEIESDIGLDIEHEVPEKMVLGKSYRLKITMANPSKDERLFDLVARAVADLPGFSQKLEDRETIGKNNRFTLIDEDYTPKKDGIFRINITARYESRFGQRFEEEMTIKTTVVPEMEAVDEPAQEEAGDETVEEEAEPKKKLNIRMPTLPSVEDKGARFSGLVLVIATVFLALLLIYLKHKVRY